jgi:hypothetical protein
MLHNGRIWVRLSPKLAEMCGMSYRTLWNSVKTGDTGFEVLRVPTKHSHRKLCYLRLDQINRALGHSLYAPPVLGAAELDTSGDNTEDTDDGDH